MATSSAIAQIHAGDDHKPDHHPSGLHHLPAIGPLYPLELAPASLQEVDQAIAGDSAPCGRCTRSRYGNRTPARAATAVGLIRGELSAVDVLLRLVVELLFRFVVVIVGLGLTVDGLGQIGPPERQLGICELNVGRRVLDRIGSVGDLHVGRLVLDWA